MYNYADEAVHFQRRKCSTSAAAGVQLGRYIQYSLSPREFFIDDNIIFLEITHGTIYDILLRDTKIYNPLILTLYRKYNSVEKVINNDKIMTLFNNIFRTKKFELYLWKDDEVIDNEYKFEGAMNISKMMKETIENNKNILIYR